MNLIEVLFNDSVKASQSKIIGTGQFIQGYLFCILLTFLKCVSMMIPCPIGSSSELIQQGIWDTLFLCVMPAIGKSRVDTFIDFMQIDRQESRLIDRQIARIRRKDRVGDNLKAGKFGRKVKKLQFNFGQVREVYSESSHYHPQFTL